MPAPKFSLGDSVVARDGTKARVVTVFDFGEDAAPEYDRQTEKRDVRDSVAEDFIVLAPDAADKPTKKVAAKTEPGAEAGTESAPVQAGDQLGSN